MYIQQIYNFAIWNSIEEEKTSYNKKLTLKLILNAHGKGYYFGPPRFLLRFPASKPKILATLALQFACHIFLVLPKISGAIFDGDIFLEDFENPEKFNPVTKTW